MALRFSLGLEESLKSAPCYRTSPDEEHSQDGHLRRPWAPRYSFTLEKFDVLLAPGLFNYYSGYENLLDLAKVPLTDCLMIRFAIQSRSDHLFWSGYAGCPAQEEIRAVELDRPRSSPLPRAKFTVLGHPTRSGSSSSDARLGYLSLDLSFLAGQPRLLAEDFWQAPRCHYCPSLVNSEWGVAVPYSNNKSLKASYNANYFIDNNFFKTKISIYF